MLIAAAQMVSGPDRAKNLEAATRLIRRAAERGASLVGLPENVAWMGSEKDRPSAAESLDGPSLTRFAELARQLRIHLLAGSIMEAGAPGGRVYNTSVLLGPEGQRLAVYRKIHLFDAEVGDGATYRESDTVAPGEGPVTAETPLGTVGLSICYDLRFPELFRSVVEKTDLFVVIANWPEKRRHAWSTLLMARAIESQCFVLGVNRVGDVRGEPHSGDSALLDPFGTARATASQETTVVTGDVDAAEVARVRERFPFLKDRRRGW